MDVRYDHVGFNADWVVSLTEEEFCENEQMRWHYRHLNDEQAITEALQGAYQHIKSEFSRVYNIEDLTPKRMIKNSGDEAVTDKT